MDELPEKIVNGFIIVEDKDGDEQIVYLSELIDYIKIAVMSEISLAIKQ